MIDLHTHSTFSDGSCSPTELVQLAKNIGLSAIALTDHNTISGLEEFEKAGATVCVIDLLENDYFVGDLADKTTLERFAAKVIADYGHVDYLINNAAPKMCGIENGSYEDFVPFISYSAYACCNPKSTNRYDIQNEPSNLRL